VSANPTFLFVCLGRGRCPLPSRLPDKRHFSRGDCLFSLDLLRKEQLPFEGNQRISPSSLDKPVFPPLALFLELKEFSLVGDLFVILFFPLVSNRLLRLPPNLRVGYIL